jgi:hypothetical protein
MDKFLARMGRLDWKNRNMTRVIEEFNFNSDVYFGFVKKVADAVYLSLRIFPGITLLESTGQMEILMMVSLVSFHCCHRSLARTSANLR